MSGVGENMVDQSEKYECLDITQIEVPPIDANEPIRLRTIQIGNLVMNVIVEPPIDPDVPVRLRTVQIGTVAMDVIDRSGKNEVTSTIRVKHKDEAALIRSMHDDAKTHYLAREAVAPLAKKVITGIDDKGGRFNKKGFMSYDKATQLVVSTEMIRQVGILRFKTSFSDFIRENAQALAIALIDAGLGETVARYLPLFAKTDDEKRYIAHFLLMSPRQQHHLVTYRHLFGSLDKNINDMIEGIATKMDDDELRPTRSTKKPRQHHQQQSRFQSPKFSTPWTDNEKIQLQ